MLYAIKNKINRHWFNFRCAGVYKTPPVMGDSSSNVIIVSQLYHPDLTMYMLAAKSLSRHITPRGFVIIDDGLDFQDRLILADHFNPIRFIPIQDVNVGKCPKGGCWERLLILCEENINQYVIQLDADILVVAEIPEVKECIRHERTFTLGTSTGVQFVDLGEASRFADNIKSNHVQICAERALGQFPDKNNFKYLRGCAGFTGFAKDHLSLEKIEQFSIRMEKLIGKDKWREWGSEQVTSNFMAANATSSLVLPIDRYPFWRQNADISQAALVHFIGSSRYHDGMYLRQARRVLGSILGQAHD